MRYQGNHGIIGSIAFALTGVAYKLLGVPSKLFGKILFLVFSKGIPMLIKGVVKLLLSIF
jgi:hypothetical protein